MQTWRYVEVKVTIDDAAGYVELRLDGVSVATFSGDTRNGGNPDIGKVQFRAQGSGNHDLYVCDTAGAQNNDFLGDVRVETLRPNADTAQADWTPSTGMDHYAVVDDAPGYELASARRARARAYPHQGSDHAAPAGTTAAPPRPSAQAQRSRSGQLLITEAVMWGNLLRHFWGKFVRH